VSGLLSSRWRPPLAALAALPLGSCGREFSTVASAGPQAARIEALTWLFVGLGSAVWLAVVGFMLYAAWRGHRRSENASGPEVERHLTRWVGGAVAVTGVILLGLLIANNWTGRALAAFGEPEALSIQVTGHQWWWEVEYLDPVPGRRFRTANEIHVPVGRRVRLLVRSGDVIHSFWVPALHGKLDLIPGYGGTTHFRADRPGVYRGQCAEFCGLQHAHMAVLVIAQPPEEFARWYQAQLHPAAAPADSMQEKGQQVFLSRGCVLCHTVRGTPAGGKMGPELTHLASRRTIAAGTLPNTRGHLGGWVVDPQKIKPGVHMPPNALAPDELHALLSYLQSLK
jgi:cytochrome c oxidase subunit 2